MVLNFEADHNLHTQKDSIRYTGQTFGKTKVTSTKRLKFVVRFNLNTTITKKQADKAGEEAEFYFEESYSVSFWK